MKINSDVLKQLGYTDKKATDLAGQLCLQMPYTVESVYLVFERRGKPYEQLTHLRSVDVKDAIKLCREKIAKAETSKRINKAQWEELLGKLEKVTL